MAYHVPPAIPRRIPCTWWIWLLWIGGLSSCLVGMFHRDNVRKPLSGPLHILGDSVMASELGIMLFLLMLVFIGIVAATTRFWRTAWGGMLIITAMLMPLCLVVASHTERLTQRFGHTFPAPWAEDAARIPWLLVGGSGVMMLTCLLAIGSSMVVARTDRSSHNPIPPIRLRFRSRSTRGGSR